MYGRVSVCLGRPVAGDAYGLAMIAARYVPDVRPKRSRRVPNTRAAREYAEAHPEWVADERPARTCAWCKAFVARGQLQSAAGWEPTRDGWRCGECAAPRRQLVGESAKKLIANSQAPWNLALMMPMHARYDLCLPCEVLAAAQQVRRFGPAEAAKRRTERTTESWEAATLPKKRCGHDDLQVLMAIDPDAAFALHSWRPERPR